MSLCRSFLDALAPGSPAPPGEGEALDAALLAVVLDGVAAWPDLPVPPERLVAQLAAGVPPGGPEDLLDFIRSTHAADLHLACACAEGDPRAIAELDRAHLNEVETAVRRIGGDGAVADETRQVVREEVLVARAGGRPGISRFSGRGDLRAWIRVTAMRHGLRILKKGRGLNVHEDKVLYQLVAPVDDPELDHIKRTYREDFEEAFREALASLTGEQRTLLRHQAIDGLSIDEIGEMHGVHRATAARWIGKARDALLSSTRRSLMKRLGVRRDECDSIMRVVQSRLDLSLDRLLVK